MNVAGWEKVSFVDFPGEVSTVFFTQGCNFRCSYCHNPDLLSLRKKVKSPCKEEILSFFRKKKGLVGAAVITGGEPAMQPDLYDFIAFLKNDAGVKVKLDTNGSIPAAVLGVNVDYIAVDLKTDRDKYTGITSVADAYEKALETANSSASAGTPTEIRITAAPGFINKEILKKIVKDIPESIPVRLQKFNPAYCVRKKMREKKPVSPEEFESMKNLLSDAGLALL
ncbi:MAG: anaerobic ribonucleoside-triphosphate reductase activating protein [Fibrobacterota bacterium]